MAKSQTSRSRQAELTKLRIFNTAVGLLSNKSFEDITVRDIVSEAGVSIGTFYNYYSTKSDVFYQAYSVADEYFSEVAAPNLRSGGVRDRIFLFFDYYARYNTEISGLKLSKLLYGMDNPCFNRIHGGITSTLTEVLRFGLGSGELFSHGESAEDIAMFFMTSVRGLVYAWCSSGGSFDLQSRTRAYAERLLRAYEK